MKILKLLNSNHLPILIIIFLICFGANAEDKPIDIWNINQNKIEKSDSENKENIVRAWMFVSPSKTCHQCIKCPEFVTNIDVAMLPSYDPLILIWGQVKKC